MIMKPNRKVEFGDFQTPPVLAYEVCKLLRFAGVSPASIMEPTCGKGAFLRASVSAFPECVRFLGVEVNHRYAQAAMAIEKVEVHCEDFFEKDWRRTLGGLRDPILVIGNPPWVTNSRVSTIGGTNLPGKSNFRGLGGLDAITGKSNFDISEWMISHLLESLAGRRAALAMLCKTTVARKVLHCAWREKMEIAMSATYSIDATKYFGASVDACLLVCILDPGARSSECVTYRDLEASACGPTFAFRDGRLVADLDANNLYGRLYGTSPLKWRSGVKHDCADVMELHQRECGSFRNGLGETVKIESTYLYPMLKSSEIAKPNPTPSRHMLVTQKRTGEDTSGIKIIAPKTWRYLLNHASYLDKRGSSIYRRRPRFSIFGVGTYSFAPWKVAISGFYKKLDFRCVGPLKGKPVMLDDTCYFLPCKTEEDAVILVRLLNSTAAAGFFRSLVFWDAKRPITAQLLASLDLQKLSAEAGVSLPIYPDAAQATFVFET